MEAPEADIERTLFLYAAKGVTTIRGMLGDPGHFVYRERVATGEVLGPRIYTSGPSFNGSSAKTPDAAVAMVVEQPQAGYDLMKVHPGVPRDAFDAMAAKGDELHSTSCRSTSSCAAGARGRDHAGQRCAPAPCAPCHAQPRPERDSRVNQPPSASNVPSAFARSV